MGLLISVEDLYGDAYKTLAKKWREQHGVGGKVKVEQHTPNDIDTADKMHMVIESARRKGCNCVIFVVDEESHNPSHSKKLQEFQRAFEELCRNVPDDIAVGFIIAHSCLECWLLSDVHAIVRYQAGKRGVRYPPRQSGQTEGYTPPRAVETITHILRQVEKEKDKRKAKRVRYEKSSSGDIAKKMQDLGAAARNNRSLKYFLDMVLCKKDGCEYRQPK
jgi:hypothetical protein